MTRRLVLAAALALALATTASAQIRGESTGWMPLATYVNDAAHDTQAAQLRAALDARGIHSVTTCSAGCTLSVTDSRWAEARLLFHALIARAHLDLTDAMPVVTS